MVVKPDRLNVGLDHLSHLDTEENEGAIDDWFLDVDQFRIDEIPDHLEEITTLLIRGHCLEGYTTTQRWNLVVRAVDYHLIVGHHYKMGLDQILR